MPDSVVIGSGPNGLAAAFVLASAGRHVIVVEEASEPGGAVRSAELTLPGFLHDVCSAVYPLAAASPVFARMELEAHGLRWLRPAVDLAHPQAGGTAALSGDVDATAASLEALAPGEAEAYRTLLSPLARSFGQVAGIGLGRWPPLGAVASAVRALGPGAAWRTMLTGTEPAARARVGPYGRALLAGCGLHADLAPDQRWSGGFGLALCLLGHAVGWPFPAGGAGALRDALVSAARRAGAEIRCGLPVEAVEARGGAVTGVFAGDERIGCREVVAETSPRELVRLAGAALPPRYARRLLAFRHADGAFKVDWALSAPVPWRDEACRRAGTLHLGGDLDELRRQVAERRSGRLPSAPFLICGQHSLIDSMRAPADRHTLWAYGLVPHRTDWPEQRDAWADRFEQQIERFAPGFRQLVLARSIHTPLDLERLNRNLVHGDVTGGAADGAQVALRPVAKAYKTPIEGLVLGSASTPPGGGVHGVCGHNAARVLLARRR